MILETQAERGAAVSPGPVPRSDAAVAIPDPAHCRVAGCPGEKSELSKPSSAIRLTEAIVRMDERRKGLALAAVGMVSSAKSLLIRIVGADRWTIVFWRGLFPAIALLVGTALQSLASIWRIGKSGLLVALLLGTQTKLFVYSLTNTLVALSAAPLFAALPERALFGQPFSGELPFSRESLCRASW